MINRNYWIGPSNLDKSRHFFQSYQNFTKKNCKRKCYLLFIFASGKAARAFLSRVARGVLCLVLKWFKFLYSLSFKYNFSLQNPKSYSGFQIFCQNLSRKSSKRHNWPIVLSFIDMAGVRCTLWIQDTKQTGFWMFPK